MTAPITAPATRDAEVVPIKPNEIQGRIDAVSRGRIFGWAWDRRNGDARLEIDVWLGDRHLGTATADRERADLAPNGIGDGRHAFELALDGVDAAQWEEVTATARAPATGARVPLARPTAAEKEVERVVAPGLIRLTQMLEAVGSSQRRAANAQAQALAGVRELVQSGQATHDERLAAVAGVLDRIADRQVALDERLASLEVFAVRVDEALRTLDGRVAQGTGGGDRGLRRWLLAVVAGTAVAVGLALYAVLRVI